MMIEDWLLFIFLVGIIVLMAIQGITAVIGFVMEFPILTAIIVIVFIAVQIWLRKKHERYDKWSSDIRGVQKMHDKIFKKDRKASRKFHNDKFKF